MDHQNAQALEVSKTPQFFISNYCIRKAGFIKSNCYNIFLNGQRLCPRLPARAPGGGGGGGGPVDNKYVVLNCSNHFFIHLLNRDEQEEGQEDGTRKME